MHFATTHGERLAGELGMDPTSYELDLDGRAGQLRVRAGRGRHHLPRAPGPARDHPRPAPEAGSAGEAGRRPLRGRLRGPAVRPPADGDPADHGEARRLRGDPRRRRRLQAAQLDGGAEPARRGRRRVDGHQPQGRAAGDHDRGGALGQPPTTSATDPGLQKDGVEAHLQELLAAACHELEVGMVLVRREHRTEIGPVDLLCRDAEGRAVAVEIKRRGEIDGVEQLARYLEFMERDPMLRPVRGMFVAQVIKPQAKALAAERGITCVEVDYDEPARHRARPDLAVLTRRISSGRRAGCCRGRRRWRGTGCRCGVQHGHPQPSLVGDPHPLGRRPRCRCWRSCRTRRWWSLSTAIASEPVPALPRRVPVRNVPPDGAMVGIARRPHRRPGAPGGGSCRSSAGTRRRTSGPDSGRGSQP